MPSMLAVAREAKVAVSTVYMALNHRHRVRPETRRRVEEAMRRVGYTPAERKDGASSGRRGGGSGGGVGSSRTLSLRVAFIYTLYTLESKSLGDDPAMSSYGREIISGIKESIAGPSSSVTIFRGVDHVEHDVVVREQINASEFDGVILFGPETSNGYLEHLQQSGVPLVVINRLPEHGRFSCVTLDYYGGAQLAIEHLVSLGHRRIGLARGGDEGKWLVRDLQAGARDALARHGLTAVFDAPSAADVPSAAEVSGCCDQLLARGATALFTSDHLAVRVANELADRGVRVPEEFSIVGFDNRGFVTRAGQTLTTVGYDKRRMGRLAVRTLQQLYRSRGRLRWSSHAVSTYLVAGQTTAQAPADK